MRRTLIVLAWVALAACAAPAQAPVAAQRPESPLVGGNDAQLLIDGPRTHAAMFAAMDGARDSINLETYILEAGEIGERLLRTVAAKTRQGVKVNVLYDGVGSIGTPADYFDRLKQAGAAVCEFNPVNPAKARRGWEVNNRNHRKILVVDGRVAFTGGINLSSVYSSGSRAHRAPQEVKPGEPSDRGWRDTHVEVEGPAVAQLQKLFLDGWAHENCPGIRSAAYYPRLEARGPKAIRVVSADPEQGRSEMYTTLLRRIGTARERVWLTVGYFVPDEEILRALVDAARRRVDVRLVLPGFSDFWAPVYAGRSHYGELLDAGVHIYEWHKSIMHAKTAVIDGTSASVGSTNLDWRSFVHNWEADVIVEDPAFAQALERRFREDAAGSIEVSASQWRSRGGLERAKEWLARQWQYFL